jgi:hypothetical protein
VILKKAAAAAQACHTRHTRTIIPANASRNASFVLAASALSAAQHPAIAVPQQTPLSPPSWESLSLATLECLRNVPAMEQVTIFTGPSFSLL